MIFPNLEITPDVLHLKLLLTRHNAYEGLFAEAPGVYENLGFGYGTTVT